MFSNYRGPAPLRAEEALVLALEIPPSTPAVTMRCAQDHLNRICKLLNVDCKSKVKVFPCMVGRGRFPGVRGGGKKMGKGARRLQYDSVLWLASLERSH